MNKYSRRNFLKQTVMMTGATALPIVPASIVLAAQGPVETSATTTGNLPYKNTYVRNVFVTENAFRSAKPAIIQPPDFAEARKELPVPQWKGHDDAIAMYWRAWELAFQNIRVPNENTGFISTYIDTAYNGNLFMWDSNFITLFARYGCRVFPFQQTLDNFYAKQHPDGFICREMWGHSGEDCFHRFDPTSTGPNVIPMSEMAYFRHFTDWDRVHKIFPVLVAYYQWLKLNRTWQDGSYWSSGWGTGMDNQPRVHPQYNQNFSHGHMTWLDTCLQQLYVAQLLVDFGFYVERWQEIEDIESETLFLKNYIREKLWNPQKAFLFDRYADGSQGIFMGIGAYWALWADVLEKDEILAFTNHLKNPDTFYRTHPIPSMPANHERYRPDGRYWQGGVWAPTNYMVIKGLKNHHINDLAFDLALKHHNQVLQVYKKTHTFFEYYAPESADPGLLARPDFVGWTGLVPIAILFEAIFGINPDALNKKLTWDVHLTDEHGIDKYPFGKEGMLSLKCASRQSALDTPSIDIESQASFDLELSWPGGKKTVHIEPGKTSI